MSPPREPVAVEIPLVLARELPEAERLLREAGVAVIEVTETAPPHRRLEGPRRVVRQRVTAAGVHLVVAMQVPLVAESQS